MLNNFRFLSISRQIIILALALSLIACASTKKQAMEHPTKTIVVGTTTRDEVQKSLGKADEKIVAEDSTDVWINKDIMNVPLPVSLIPIVGDVADLAELMHKNRELIVQFDSLGVVRKVKVRDVD